MMPETRKKARLALLLAGMPVLLMMQPGGKAAAAADKTITLICRQDGTILSGMEWKLYRVGERDGSEIAFVPALSGYSMDLGDLSPDTIDTAAKTVESYLIAAGVQPIAQGKTGTAGELAFGGLENGLYLADGKNLQVGETCYFPSTMLIEIRDADASVDYDAYPKFYFTLLSGDEKKLTVKKVWNDDDNRYQKRPDSLTVDLYKDGALNKTATLNEENSWTYSWTALDDGAEWTVAERDIPVPYKVMIDYNSTQFVIQNSDSETAETTAPPGTGTTAASTVTTVTTAPPNKLVQTGQLWWPVLPLSLVGVLLVGAGISMRAGKKKHEE